jgi:hypothetical protein
MENTILQSVYIHSKENICIETKELNRMDLKNRFSEYNLCPHDVMKLKVKAKKHLKNSKLVFYNQQSRAKHVSNLKEIYPNYSFKQLREIGFNI